MEISYSSLREIQRKEHESAALEELEPDFYPKVLELLEKKKKEAVANSSILAVREYENMKKILLDILTKREEKIVFMALRGEEDNKNLTEEERVFLKKLIAVVNEYREKMTEKFLEKKPRFKKVTITKDVEQYRGLDNNIYGPFKEGDVVELPTEEAEWLIKIGYGKEV